MLRSFDSLREQLLRAGIAPRHVRRHVTELREHLADLTAAQRASGLDAGQAADRAMALAPEGSYGGGSVFSLQGMVYSHGRPDFVATITAAVLHAAVLFAMAAAASRALRMRFMAVDA